MNSILLLQGKLSIHNGASLRLPFGRLIFTTDMGEGTTTSMFPTNLSVVHTRNGEVIDERDFGSGVITTAGVNLMAADWTNATATIKLINFHDTGTGTAPATIANTALSSATGQVRIAGTQSNTNNVYNTIGVTTYNSPYSITEWGLFTALTSGTLFDRRQFNPISVILNDQLTWNYSLTIQPGG